MTRNPNAPDAEDAVPSTDAEAVRPDSAPAAEGEPGRVPDAAQNLEADEGDDGERKRGRPGGRGVIN